MRFFCSLFGFLTSPPSELGDCLSMFRNPRPDDAEGVLLTERSVTPSLPLRGARRGVVSRFGVWKSRVTVEEASLPMPPASGVVASLEDADVISIGAGGRNVATAGATGVLCNDS